MNRKKQNKKNQIFLVLLLLSVLIFILEVPRKTYNIVKLSYEKRLDKNYDYCSERAVGFLNHIKKKYNITKPVNFIKYTGVRNPKWIFFDRSNEQNQNLYVLINYNNDNEIFLEKINKNKFKYNFNHMYNHREYKFFEIHSNKNFTISDFKIYNNDKVLYNLDSSQNKKNTNVGVIKIDINNDLNKILQENQKNEKDLIFEFKNDFISKINIKVEHTIDINNFKITEKINNCYLVKLND
tara:strand:- start:7646 stop:8362 length:717 start_codon:yes stop_codon:yes gene_type:complete